MRQVRQIARSPLFAVFVLANFLNFACKPRHGLMRFFCTMCAALTLYLTAKDDDHVRQRNH